MLRCVAQCRGATYFLVCIGILVWATIENMPYVWVEGACQSIAMGTGGSCKIAPEGFMG